MSRLKALLVKANLLWGFSTKIQSQTATQDAIPLPPPTTVLGALASSYARYFGLPETIYLKGRKASTAVELLHKGVIKYATSGLINAIGVKHSDMLRNIMLPYQRHKEPRYHFAVHSMGRVYVISNRSDLVLVYLVNDQFIDLVSKLAWGITAIGSKEGIISVSDVSVIELSDIKKIPKGYILETIFMTPFHVASCEINCIEIDSCDLREESYYSGIECPRTRYLVPVNPKLRELYGGDMRVRLKNDAYIAELQLINEKKTNLIIPEGVFEGGKYP